MDEGIIGGINSQLTTAVDQVSIWNLLLIILATGLVVWIVRQILPDAIEETRLWQVLLKVVPVGIGALVALIPGVRPVDNLVQSIFLGMIGGSFAQGAYGFLRAVAPEKAKALLGSRSQRNKINNGDE